MEEYLIDRYYKYPKMQVEDFIKMIYQAEFGNAHIMLDEEKALDNLKAELSSSIMRKHIKEDLIEDISDDYVLVNLRVFKKKKMDINKLSKALVASSLHNYGTISGFMEKVATLKKLIQKNIIILDKNAIYIIDKYCENILPIHHSITYQKSYKPSYRILERKELEKLDIKK